MQVRKFEARSMKEALDMVKNQLGPDAIILSAKDNSRAYGLAGNGSVEITAAVAEETLRRKQFVESRMRQQEREKINRAPARVQRQFIDDMVDSYQSKNAVRKAVTSTRYIEIDDEQGPALSARPNWTETAKSMVIEPDIEANGSTEATARIRSAAKRAWSAMNNQMEFLSQPSVGGSPPAMPETPLSPAAVAPRAGLAIDSNAKSTAEYEKLREELVQLKSVLSNIQKVPQATGQHPGSDYGLPYEFASLFEKLLAAGLAPEIIGGLLQEAQKEMPLVRFKNRALVEGWVARKIMDTTPIVGDLQGTRVQVFVGPSGAGKTSALVKLASHYVVNAHKKVALLTTDTFKVGATDQLRIYSQILNVPFAIVRSVADWDYVLQQLSGYDYILCDCPGLSLRSVDEIQMLKNLMPRRGDQVSVHLVLNATAKDQDLSEMGRRYKALTFKDVIFSNLDDSVQHGGIYNFVQRFSVPLHSFGIGPRVPEDFEAATRERVVDLVFRLSKVKKTDEASAT